MKRHVICIGDMILDEFVVGDVHRISPEAPVPVLLVRSRDRMPGGVGNVVRNLLALGQPCALATVIGDDDSGCRALQSFTQIETGIAVETGRITPIKTRYCAQGHHLLRVDEEQTSPINRETEIRLVNIIRDLIISDCIVILSDYRKGTLTPYVIENIMNTCRERGAIILVDPKDQDYSRYTGANIIKPNLSELALATDFPVDTHDDIVAAARWLIARHGFGAVLVTLGRDGMCLIDADSVEHLSAEAKDVYDVSGAGDTVIATLAAMLAQGRSTSEALWLANRAAGLVVHKRGTATVTQEELFA